MKKFLAVSIGLLAALSLLAGPAQAATAGQRNALRKAHEYLDYGAFSKTGLEKQLEFERFSTSDSRWAVNHCGANWYAQAVKKAREYLKYSSFSRQGLISQLEFEGFTHAQAVYGVKKAYH